MIPSDPGFTYSLYVPDYSSVNTVLLTNELTTNGSYTFDLPFVFRLGEEVPSLGSSYNVSTTITWMPDPTNSGTYRPFFSNTSYDLQVMLDGLGASSNWVDGDEIGLTIGYGAIADASGYDRMVSLSEASKLDSSVTANPFYASAAITPPSPSTPGTLDYTISERMTGTPSSFGASDVLILTSSMDQIDGSTGQDDWQVLGRGQYALYRAAVPEPSNILLLGLGGLGLTFRRRRLPQS